MVGGKAGTVYKLCPVCNAGRTGTNGFQMLIMPLSVRMQELAAPIQSLTHIYHFIHLQFLCPV